eukprot:gene10474-11396_t
MDATMLFQVLDRDVTASVLSEWLHFKDIAHLTIAMTNHSLRETYLNLLCDYRVKLKGTDLSNVYLQPLLSWCCNYRIRVSELIVQEKFWTQLTKSQHLFLLTDLESLSIRGCAVPNPVAAGNNHLHHHAAGMGAFGGGAVGVGVFPVAPPLLFQHGALPIGLTIPASQIKDYDRFPMISLLSCPHLKKLHFSRLSGLPVVFPLQQVTPKLEELLLHQITFSDDEYGKLFESFQSLKHLTLHDISYFPLSLINKSLKNLKSLNLIECSFPVHVIDQFFVTCLELEEIKIVPKPSIPSNNIGDDDDNGAMNHNHPPSFISSTFIDQLLARKPSNVRDCTDSLEESSKQVARDSPKPSRLPRYRQEMKREIDEDEDDMRIDDIGSDPLIRLMMLEDEDDLLFMQLFHDFDDPSRAMPVHRNSGIPARRRELMMQMAPNSLSRSSTMSRTNTTSSTTSNSSYSSSRMLLSTSSVQSNSPFPLLPVTTMNSSSSLSFHPQKIGSTSATITNPGNSKGNGKYGLRSIILHNVPISKDIILANFISQNNKPQHLQTLDVRYCYQISNDTCHALSQYASQTLQHLNLSGTNITDYGLTEILIHCLQLITLDISFCNNITDNSLFVLRHSYHYHLISLNLENCSQITDKGIKYLCKQLRSLQILNIKSIGGSLISSLTSTSSSPSSLSPTHAYSMLKMMESNAISNNMSNMNSNDMISPFDFLPFLRCLSQLTIGFYEVPGFCTMNEFRLMIEKCSQLRVLNITKLPFSTQGSFQRSHPISYIPHNENIGSPSSSPRSANNERDLDKEFIAILRNHHDRRRKGIRSIPSITIKKELLSPEHRNRLLSSIFYQAFRTQALDRSPRSSSSASTFISSSNTCSSNNTSLFLDLELNYRLESLHLRLVNYQDADLLFFIIYFQSLQEICIDRCSQFTSLGLSFLCKYGFSLKKIVIKDCLHLDLRQFINISEKFGFQLQPLTQPELEQPNEKVFVRYCMYYL